MFVLLYVWLDYVGWIVVGVGDDVVWFGGGVLCFDDFCVWGGVVFGGWRCVDVVIFGLYYYVWIVGGMYWGIGCVVCFDWIWVGYLCFVVCVLGVDWLVGVD